MVLTMLHMYMYLVNSVNKFQIHVYLLEIHTLCLWYHVVSVPRKSYSPKNSKQGDNSCSLTTRNKQTTFSQTSPYENLKFSQYLYTILWAMFDLISVCVLWYPPVYGLRERNPRRNIQKSGIKWITGFRNETEKAGKRIQSQNLNNHQVGLFTSDFYPPFDFK